jgi:hypothetical protein
MSTVNAKSIERLAIGLVLNKNIFPINADFLQALQEFPWKPEPDQGLASQPEAEWDLELDVRSSLGRLALAAAFVGLHFPEINVSYAEVLEDTQAQRVLNNVRNGSPRNTDDCEELLQAVLVYERRAHGVLVLDENQFDSLWTLKEPVQVAHPKVQAYSIWEAVASTVMVSKARLEEDVPEKKLELLEEAGQICPGTALVAEEKVKVLVELERTEEAIQLLKDLLVKRPSAETLLALYTLTRDKAYQESLDREYTRHMYYVLLKEKTERFVA